MRYVIVPFTSFIFVNVHSSCMYSTCCLIVFRNIASILFLRRSFVWAFDQTVTPAVSTARVDFIWLQIAIMCFLSVPEPPGCVSSGECLLWEQVWGEDDASSAVPTRHGRVSQTYATLQVLRQGVCLRHNPGQNLSFHLKLLPELLLNSGKTSSHLAPSASVYLLFILHVAHRRFPASYMVALSRGSWMSVWAAVLLSGLFMCKHLPLYTSGQRLSTHSPLPSPTLWGPNLFCFSEGIF